MLSYGHIPVALGRYGASELVYEQSDMISDLPENCHYHDNGCTLADSCLKCPFPRCVYDLPRGGSRLFKAARNKEITRLFALDNTVNELATKFGVSSRTIYRILKKKS